MGDKHIQAKAGDFIQFPRKIVHAFRNVGSEDAKMLVFCSPAGLENFFEEIFEPVQDRSAAPPPITDALIGRMMKAAPKYDLELSPH